MEVAAGAAPGSLAELDLFEPQAVMNASRHATTGRRSFFIGVEIKSFPPNESLSRTKMRDLEAVDVVQQQCCTARNRERMADCRADLARLDE